MFRTVALSIIMNFFTVHTAMVYVKQVFLTACEQDQDGTGSILIHTPDAEQRNCPKHVQF